MKFVIDRIEDNVVVLQNLDNKKIHYEKIDKMPCGTTSKSVLRYENGKYVLDEKLKDERLKTIKEKMKMVKKLDN